MKKYDIFEMKYNLTTYAYFRALYSLKVWLLLHQEYQ